MGLRRPLAFRGRGVLTAIVVKWQHFGWAGMLSALCVKVKSDTGPSMQLVNLALPFTAEGSALWASVDGVQVVAESTVRIRQLFLRSSSD